MDTALAIGAEDAYEAPGTAIVLPVVQKQLASVFFRS